MIIWLYYYLRETPKEQRINRLIAGIIDIAITAYLVISMLHVIQKW